MKAIESIKEALAILERGDLGHVSDAMAVLRRCTRELEAESSRTEMLRKACSEAHEVFGNYARSHAEKRGELDEKSIANSRLAARMLQALVCPEPDPGEKKTFTFSADEVGAVKRAVDALALIADRRRSSSLHLTVISALRVLSPVVAQARAAALLLNNGATQLEDLLHAEVETLRARLREDIGTQMSTATAERDEARRQRKEAQAALEAANNDLAASRAEVAKLRADRDAAYAHSDNLEDLLDNLNALVTESLPCAGGDDDEAGAAECVEHAKKELAELRAALAASRAEVEALRVLLRRALTPIGAAWRRAVWLEDDASVAELEQIFADAHDHLAALSSTPAPATAEPATPTTTTTKPRHLGDPCAACGHSFNWHVNPGRDEGCRWDGCRCTAFVATPTATPGLYRKYSVTRTDGSSGPGGKHEHCRYFVLDLSHDPFSMPALIAYAAACKPTHPDLAADLIALATPTTESTE